MIEKSQFKLDTKEFNTGVLTLIRNSPFVADRILKRIGLELLTKVKELTPVKSGTLRKRWYLTKPKKNAIAVQNNVNYGLAVEKGHETKSKTFVKGRFMLARAIDTVEPRAKDIVEDEMQKMLDKLR